jgi:hypothetical protein
MHALTHHCRAAFAILAIILVAGCATNKLLSSQANPEFVGKPPKRVMVHVVAYDQTLRRVFEDRMVTLLEGRGIQGVTAYSIFPGQAEIKEDKLREAIAKAGVDSVMITRTGVEESSTTLVSGGTVAVGTGTGMGGMYGYYGGVWQVTEVAPTTVGGATWMTSSTRLFDVKTGNPVWAGSVKTSMDSGDTGRAMQQYIDVIFAAMVKDRVL